MNHLKDRNSKVKRKLHCLLLSLTLCVIDKVRRFTHKIHSPSYTFCTQGLISGSAELREQAALGLGELIEVTSEQSLKIVCIPLYVTKFYNQEFDMLEKFGSGRILRT